MERNGAMPNTPQDEDEEEQPEYLQTRYQPQRRRKMAEPGRAKEYHHSDEHPEIPKIRRASRLQDEAQQAPEAPTNKTARLSKPLKSSPLKSSRNEEEI